MLARLRAVLRSVIGACSILAVAACGDSRRAADQTQTQTREPDATPPQVAASARDASRVPDVSGQSVDFAEQTLRAAGLRASRAMPPRSERRAPLDFGPLVVRTEPPVGSTVARGTSVALRTVARLELPSEESFSVPFDRVRVVDDRTIQVRVPVPGRCCRLEPPAAQVVGRVVRVRVSVRPRGDVIAFGDRRRWLEVRLPEPLAGRPVLPAVGELTRAMPTYRTSPAPQETPIVMPDDRTLVVRYLSGVPACYALNRVIVRERAKTVTLSVRVGAPRHNPRDGVCIQPGITSLAVVRLDRPLGDRRIRGGGR